MKTFTLKGIQHIQEFQFLTDSSGFVLDKAGHLYRFKGNTTEPVATPPSFTVSQFHLVDEAYGAAIGHSRPVLVPKGALGSTGLGLLLIVRLALRKTQHQQTGTQRWFAGAFA